VTFAAGRALVDWRGAGVGIAGVAGRAIGDAGRFGAGGFG
jgi:hypothetical protein